MTRRILTAREQLQMLSPWREASNDDQWMQDYQQRLRQDREDRRQNATKIYRGLRFDAPPDLQNHIDEHYRKDVPYDYDEIGGHLAIGPKLLDHLQVSHPNLLNYGNGYGYDDDDKLGLGRHWTTNRQLAEKAAMQGGKGRHGVILEADRPGPEHRDPNHTGVGGSRASGHTPWQEEEEDTLRPGTPLNITSVHLNGKEVLHDPKLEKKMPEQYGLPYPGGPRQHKARVRQAMEPNIKWDSRPTDEEDLEAAWSEEPHPFHVNLPVDEVAKYANPDNIYDREGYRRLHDDVARSGEIRSPIVIETDGRRGWIDDGHHRLRVAQELGLDQVPVSVRRMARDDYPWASGGKWVPGELGAGLSDFIQKNPNFQEGWVRYRGTWPDRTAYQHIALSEDEGQKMREVYAPHDPANPPEHLKPHLMLPIGAAHHYREYDRPYDDVLGQVIADQGIRQPLRISTDGTHATMHEGNHRLEIAKRLGLTHVPVQVTLEKPGEVINNGGRPPAPLEQHLGDWVDQNRHRLKSFWKG